MLMWCETTAETVFTVIQALWERENHRLGNQHTREASQMLGINCAGASGWV